MSVGKVYAGLLMVENYRTYKTSLAKYGGNKDPSQKSAFFNRLIGTVKSNSNSQTPKPGDGSERLIFCYLFF
jgi:hypothetical protein